MRKIAPVLSLLVFLADSAIAADTVYPTGSDLVCSYNLNSQSTTTADTISITRVFTNNEAFNMTGMYFSENVPTNFSLINHNVTKNYINIGYQFDNAQTSMYSGNNCYYWIIDNPSGSPANILYPGETVVLTYQLLCQTEGSYSLPIHTFTCYGNGSSFFATDNSISINVFPAEDTIPPENIDDLSGL